MMKWYEKWYHERKQKARERYLAGHYPNHERVPNFVVRCLYEIGYFFADFVPLILNLIDGIYATIKRLVGFIVGLLVDSSIFIVLIGSIIFSVSHSIERLREAGATNGLEYIGVLMFEVIFISSAATLTGFFMKKKKPGGALEWVGLIFTILGFGVGLGFVWWSNVNGMAPTREGFTIGSLVPLLVLIGEVILAYRYFVETKNDDQTELLEFIQRNKLTTEDVVKAIKMYIANTDNNKEENDTDNLQQHDNNDTNNHNSNNLQQYDNNTMNANNNDRLNDDTNKVDHNDNNQQQHDNNVLESGNNTLNNDTNRENRNIDNQQHQQQHGGNLAETGDDPLNDDTNNNDNTNDQQQHESNVAENDNDTDKEDRNDNNLQQQQDNNDNSNNANNDDTTLTTNINNQQHNTNDNNETKNNDDNNKRSKVVDMSERRNKRKELDRDTVIKIFLAEGSNAQIAKRFGVSAEAVRKIKNGERHAEVTAPYRQQAN